MPHDEGNVIFKFKMKASGTNGKTGDTLNKDQHYSIMN